MRFGISEIAIQVSKHFTWEKQGDGQPEEDEMCRKDASLVETKTLKYDITVKNSHTQTGCKPLDWFILFS